MEENINYYFKNRTYLLEKAFLQYELNKEADKDRYRSNARNTAGKQVQCEYCKRIISKGNVTHKYSFKCRSSRYNVVVDPLQVQLDFQTWESSVCVSN